MRSVDERTARRQRAKRGKDGGQARRWKLISTGKNWTEEGQGSSQQQCESPDRNTYSRGKKKQRRKGDALAVPALGKLDLEEALTQLLRVGGCPGQWDPY